MKTFFILLSFLLASAVHSGEAVSLLKPVKGYGWKETVLETGDPPVFVYTKDSGYKSIIILKNPNVIDLDNKQDIVDFWGGFKSKVNVIEVFNKGKEKFLGQDSYYFDFKSEKNGNETYTTINIVTVNKIQYFIQRQSTVVDPKVDEEMLTILATLK